MPTDVNLDWRGEEMPFQYCPNCGTKLNAGVSCLEEGARPSPGDLCVCYSCAAFLYLTDLMILRELTQEEVDGLPDNLREHLLECASFIKDNNPP